MTDNSALKIIFAGTPEFAIPSLQALIDSPHQIVAVYTQPDRSAGRGQQLTMSPVKQLALQHHLPVMQPLSLRDVDAQHALKSFNADVMIVIAYGLILPLAVLQTPRLGCINVHASLLPRWRGAAPIQRAILAGDKESGVTIMQMAEGLDTGPMLHKISCPIDADDTSQMLHDRLAQLGSQALLQVLTQINAGTLTAQQQDEQLTNYASKISKQEGLINWHDTADAIERQIRAFNPWPVAYTVIEKQNVRVFKAEVISVATKATPGTILAANANGIDVATFGNKALRILELQLPGGKKLHSKELLNARASLFSPGKILGNA